MATRKNPPDYCFIGEIRKDFIEWLNEWACVEEDKSLKANKIRD